MNKYINGKIICSTAGKLPFFLQTKCCRGDLSAAGPGDDAHAGRVIGETTAEGFCWGNMKATGRLQRAARSLLSPASENANASTSASYSTRLISQMPDYESLRLLRLTM